MLIEDASFTVFDFETTGLYPYSGDRICEIGAVRIDPEGNEHFFETLVDPEREVSPGAFSVNGITRSMVAGKPLIKDVVDELLLFMKGSVLVAYNAGFDLGFLESALGERKEVLRGMKTIDVLKLARRLFPGVARYRLSSVAEHLGIDTAGGHRAMADAKMTLEVFKKIMAILKARDIFTVEEIAEPSKMKASEEKELNGVIGVIREALSRKSAISITYKSTWDNSVTSRDVTPIELKQGYDRTYLTAFCHLKNAERNFRLDCIIQAKSK
jgi:DNA polymerase-3 subunit epsilon